MWTTCAFLSLLKHLQSFSYRREPLRDNFFSTFGRLFLRLYSYEWILTGGGQKPNKKQFVIHCFMLNNLFFIFFPLYLFWVFFKHLSLLDMSIQRYCSEIVFVVYMCAYVCVCVISFKWLQVSFFVVFFLY